MIRESEMPRLPMFIISYTRDLFAEAPFILAVASRGRCYWSLTAA
jgi:hypothetical protein